MDYNILVVDINSLLESGEILWAFIGTLGVGVVFSTLTFIKTSVSGKKFRKVSDFAVVADQSMKFAKKEMVKAKEQLLIETQKTIVEPLKEQVNALLSDNAQLASLTVSLLSYINLPLPIKKDAIKVISTLGNVSAEALKLLESSTAYQENQEAQEQTANTDLTENIDGI